MEDRVRDPARLMPRTASQFDYAPPCHPELVELLGSPKSTRRKPKWDLGGASLRMTRTKGNLTSWGILGGGTKMPAGAIENLRRSKVEICLNAPISWLLNAPFLKFFGGVGDFFSKKPPQKTSPQKRTPQKTPPQKPRPHKKYLCAGFLKEFLVIWGEM